MPLDFGVRHPPKIQVSWFNSNHILQKQAVFSGYFSVGRSLDNDFVITSPAISRRHFGVKWENDNWWIEDLQSSNGTYVNQNLIKQRCLLALPAIVTMGNFEILLKIETVQSASERIEHTTGHLAPSPQPISQKNLSKKTFSKDELKVRLLAQKEDDNAGEYTRMVRSIIHEDQTKRSKSYKKAIWRLSFLLLFSVSLTGYQYNALSKANIMAIDMFYDIKALEISLAQAEIKLEENEAVLGLTLETIAKERLNINQERIRVERQKMAAERKRVAQERLRLAGMRNKYQQYVDEAKSFKIRFPTDTQYEEELIVRIARGFGESELELPHGFISEVKRYIEYWKNSPRLQRAVNHLEKNYYTHVIIDALEKEGLPLYFMYLPLQESNYDTNAIGPETRFGIAKGAWQLLATTAQDYGLKLGPLANAGQYDDRDERFVFERATHAGTKHLKHIYSTEAQASGLLVMASYNFGHTRVREMINKMEPNPRERNFWKFIQQNNLPKETYDYVFYIFSAAVIGEDPKHFGFDFKPPLAMYAIK